MDKEGLPKLGGFIVMTDEEILRKFCFSEFRDAHTLTSHPGKNYVLRIVHVGESE